MRFARVGESGVEHPVVSGTDGVWRDLTPITPDIDAQFVGRLDQAGIELAALPEVSADGRFGPPIIGMGKIVCIGLNYRDHAVETGLTLPAEPVVFLKAPDTVVGPTDQVLVPRNSTKTDWEVELAVVMKARARYLGSPGESRELIAGYAIGNDITEREFQFDRGGQWDKGKNCETFNPLGPWLATADEVPDPQALDMRLWLNGEIRQHSSTKEMIFGVDYLIWYLSQMMVLYPGDVISTGTPAGVAYGSADQRYLRNGDVLELEIAGLGRQRQEVVQS